MGGRLLVDFLCRVKKTTMKLCGSCTISPHPQVLNLAFGQFVTLNVQKHVDAGCGPAALARKTGGCLAVDRLGKSEARCWLFRIPATRWNGFPKSGKMTSSAGALQKTQSTTNNNDHDAHHTPTLLQAPTMTMPFTS